jgi:hypothetical protein
MSIPVSPDGLRAAVAERSTGAYLLTVSGDGRPHAVHVAVTWEGDALAADLGKRSAANAAARPAAVSLVYPVRSPDDYSLILDGTAAVESAEGGPRLRFTPTKAVLHRAASVADATSACGADCVPLLPASRAERS